MAAKFTLYKDKGGLFRFNLKAANGEIIAVASEGYPEKKSALKGIASVVKSAAVAVIADTTIEKETSKKAAGKPVAAKAKAPAKAKTPAKPEAAPTADPKL